MQDIIIYAVVENGLARCVAPNSNQSVAAPTLLRGCKCRLDLRVPVLSEEEPGWPLENIDLVKSWQWVMNDGFNSSGTAVLAGDNENIAVGEVAVNGTVYLQFVIPITRTDTCEVRSFLGFEELRTGLNGELTGFDSDGEEIFVLQILDFTLRSRIDAEGIPEASPERYLLRAQAAAMVRSGVTVEVSNDQTQWSEYTSQLNWADYSWWRWRTNLPEAPYSPVLPLGQGGGAKTPMTAQCFYHDTYGTVVYLDDDNLLEVVGYQSKAWKTLDLYLVTADSSVTGDIVLVLGENRLVAQVTAELTELTWNLTVPAAGLITITRETADAEDTLKDADGNVVTALLADWRVS